MSESDNPPDEWTDDRVQQGTLGTEDPTQYRETKTDEGTDKFADDRADVYDPVEDMGSQASLTPEKVSGGQQSLGGGEAEVGPEWDDEEDGDNQEGADDRQRDIPDTLADSFELTDTEHSGRTTTWTWTAPATNEQMETFNVAIISKPSAYTVIQGPGNRDTRDWSSDGEFGTFGEALRSAQEAAERAISGDPPLVETDSPSSDDDSNQGDDDGGDDREEREANQVEAAALDLPNEWEKVDGPVGLEKAEFGYKNDHDGILRVAYVDYPSGEGWAPYYFSPDRHERYHLHPESTADSKAEAVEVAEAYARSPWIGPYDYGTYLNNHPITPEQIANIEGWDELDALIDSVESEGDEVHASTGKLYDPTEDAETDGGTVDDRVPDGERIEFGSLDAANEFRDEHPDALHPDDKRTTKTVHFHPDADDNVLNRAGSEALKSRKQTKSYGQAKLTDTERDRLEDRDGWSWGTHGFHAMASKAILQEEGATPWLDYYDHTLDTAAEHISIAESGKEMSVETGGKGPGETGMRDDSTKSDAELAQDLDKGEGEMCKSARSACEDGIEDACSQLLDDCGWSADEIEQIRDAAVMLGEDPGEIYDPAVDTDSGQSFEEWARENEPANADPEIPEKPDPVTEPGDEELARLAPTPSDDSGEVEAEMTGTAYRALKKAWSGYKLARKDARESHDEAENYAAVINGIRAVNGQDPLTFEQIEEWRGGEVMPDDPSETFPAPEGAEETLAEAAEHGHASGIVQQTFDQISEMAGDVMDPTEGL